MGFFSKIKAMLLGKRKKAPVLGLALGSGGAKGMAHLGVLRAFEEEGISFSVVTGTSIGSIVGALYAKGYSSADMSAVVRNLSLKEFTGKLRPFADMAFIEEYLSRYLDGDISDLKLPFAAWATDSATNEGVLLGEGNVAKALTASASIPPFFRAVEWGDKRLVDGAFTNAIPADVCRELGADFVVGCDLSAFKKSDEEKSGMSRLLDGALSAFVNVQYLPDSKTRGYEASDIMLRPNLINFRAIDASPSAMEAMFELGYEEAKSRMDEIKTALGEAGFET